MSKLQPYLAAIARQGTLGKDVEVTIYSNNNQKIKINKNSYIGTKGFKRYRVFSKNAVTNPNLYVKKMYSFGFNETKTLINIVVEERK